LRFLPVLLAAALGWVSFATAQAYEYEDGSVKVSLSGYLDSRAVAPFSRDVPKEYPTTVLGLDCKTTIASWSAIKIFMQAIDNGTVIDPENGKLFNQFDKIYQDKNPCIDADEAYIDLFSEKADLRIGIQKFSWGRMDEVNPTDNINPEDFSQGTINEELERKIGIPAVKLNSYTDIANVELAWIPRYVPYRLPQPDEKWYPNPLKAPAYVETNGTAGYIPVTSQHEDITIPEATWNNSEWAGRISRYLYGWDVSASYYHGYDVMPITDVYSDLTVTLVNPLALEYDLSLDVTYKPVVHQMDVYGFDFTTTLGSFTIRGEFAYYDEKYYNRMLDSVLSEELSKSNQEEIYNEFQENYISSGGTLTTQTFQVNPQINIPYRAMKYGFGADYIYGDSSVSLQFIQEYIPDYDNTRPVYFIYENGCNTLLTALFRQLFLQNTLELVLSGAYGVEFKDYLIKPSMKYSFTNTLQGTIGVVILGGKEINSMFGQYSHNDEAYVQLRCSF
jgi:hypothetical protein